jgi:peptide/nickel transport system permease protein
MRGLLLRKIGAALIVVFLASVVVFAGLQALPGNPALVLAGEDRSPAALAEIVQKFGLDDPLPVQYATWLQHALQGDFGE